MTTTQKAIIINEKFGEFKLGTIPVPKPGPGELVVKVKSASLNPIDWKIRNFGQKFPIVLGLDIAGDVEAVGEGVAEFKVGDKVFGQGDYVEGQGAFQQYSVRLASTTARIPPNLSYDEVASLPVALSASYIGLYHQAPYGLGIAPPTSPATQGTYAGTPILILGGGSSLGQIAIQLAKLSGFSPIITTASLKHADALKSFGADQVLDRNSSPAELSAAIKSLTDKPLKLIYDSISTPNTQQQAIDALAPGGALAIVGHPIKEELEDGKTLASVRSFLRMPQNVEILETLYHDLITGFLERGFIKPIRVEVLPNGLAGVPDGLARMERNEVSRLKLVAHPDETS